MGRLESQGVVDRHVAGRNHTWSIAPNNVFVPVLRTLFGIERGLAVELESDLRKALVGLPAQRAILFGSVARGDETGWSDVDLLVEVESARLIEQVWDALDPLAGRIREKFGLTLAPLVIALDEGQGQLSPSFLDTVEREGKVVKARD
ncbi:MAG: nucleotidyltransferase family protein [Candidatus Lutacidiplasmatales archaeon]